MLGAEVHVIVLLELFEFVFELVYEVALEMLFEFAVDAGGRTARVQVPRPLDFTLTRTDSGQTTRGPRRIITRTLKLHVFSNFANSSAFFLRYALVLTTTPSIVSQISYFSFPFRLILETLVRHFCEVHLVIYQLAAF